MRASTRTRAMIVVAVTLGAVTVAAGLSSGAFGITRGRRFASSPGQARVHRIPAALSNRSISQCPAGGQTVQVHLMNGTATLASASTTADVVGKWTVAMSIPSSLQIGRYAVTAACFDAGAVATLSYNPQTFRVVPPSCGPEPTTSTTARCRPQPPQTGGTGSPGQPGSHASLDPFRGR